MTVLAIASLDDQLSFDIRYMEGKIWSTSVTFISTPSSEQRMKVVFEQLGLKLPDKSEIPVSFFKDQAVYAIYQISPEPVGAAGLAALATRIFRDFCGMQITAEVRVRVVEVTNKQQGS